eukprot:82596-Hanusia_phi.AAC.1
MINDVSERVACLRGAGTSIVFLFRILLATNLLLLIHRSVICIRELRGSARPDLHRRERNAGGPAADLLCQHRLDQRLKLLHIERLLDFAGVLVKDRVLVKGLDRFVQGQDLLSSVREERRRCGRVKMSREGAGGGSESKGSEQGGRRNAQEQMAWLQMDERVKKGHAQPGGARTQGSQT